MVSDKNDKKIVELRDVVVDRAIGDNSVISKGLKEGESLDRRVTDYFYLLLALPPFSSFVKNENRARNLAILSQLLNTFQNYYGYTVVTFKNRIA